MAKGEASCHRHRRPLTNYHTWTQRKIKWFWNQGWRKCHCIRYPGFQARVCGCSTPLGGLLCHKNSLPRGYLKLFSCPPVSKLTGGMRRVSHGREETNIGELLKNRERTFHDLHSNHSKTAPWDNASLLPVSCVYLAIFTPPPNTDWSKWSNIFHQMKNILVNQGVNNWKIPIHNGEDSCQNQQEMVHSYLILAYNHGG